MRRPPDPRDSIELPTAEAPPPRAGRWRERASPWGKADTLGEAFAQDATAGRAMWMDVVYYLGMTAFAACFGFALQLNAFVFGMLSLAVAVILLWTFVRRVQRLRKGRRHASRLDAKRST